MASVTESTSSKSTSKDNASGEDVDTVEEGLVGTGNGEIGALFDEEVLCAEGALVVTPVGGGRTSPA